MQPYTITGALIQARPSSLASPSDFLEDSPCTADHSLPPRPLLEHEDALLVGRDDIEQAVAVEVGDDELGADAALVVDLARGEGDLAVAPRRASNQ